jgi:hypothetical protein
VNAAIETAALLITALGVVSFLTAYATVRSIRCALPLLLDFLMAAGLIRLAGDLSWSSILLTVAIVVVRKIAAFGVAGKSTA